VAIITELLSLLLAQLSPLLGFLCLVFDRLAALRNVLACTRNRVAAGEKCGTSNQHRYNQSNHYLPRLNQDRTRLILDDHPDSAHYPVFRWNFLLKGDSGQSRASVSLGLERLACCGPFPHALRVAMLEKVVATSGSKHRHKRERRFAKREPGMC
jgi:hypothetical protein